MLTTAVGDVRKMEVGCKLIPKKLGWLSVTQALSSLARLTLRQLRQMASDLGVTLYSRKSKEDLVSAIAERQDRRDGDLKAVEAELHAPSMPEASTRVVFLPRDPQWAYVFWEISDSDRRQAQSEGAAFLCLRLADVTGLENGSSHPHTLQEVPVDSHSTEWYASTWHSHRMEVGIFVPVLYCPGQPHPSYLLIKRSYVRATYSAILK